MTSLRSMLRTAADALLTVLVAAPCAACARLLDQPTRGPICDACWASVLPLTPPLCSACGDPLTSWRPTSVARVCCARCRRSRRALDRARAVGAYDGALRSIIHALKYDGLRSLARPLATLMRQRGAHVLTGADAAVPVPLHPSRRRMRGFNQAADLAACLGLPVIHALRRVRATAPQTGLPAARRHRNVRGAFMLTTAASALRGRTVVVVDDVCTTGATLEACARALKEGGCLEVRGLTAARVVTSPR